MLYLETNFSDNFLTCEEQNPGIHIKISSIKTVKVKVRKQLMFLLKGKQTFLYSNFFWYWISFGF